MKTAEGLKDIITPENLVYRKSSLIPEKPFSYCPGCGRRNHPHNNCRGD
jgi:hypothetical protein